jgi:hypothetical protein
MNKWHYSAVIVSLIMILGLHPFLALNKPVDAKVMVIEGWIPEASLQNAVKIFKAQNYEMILTNGGRIKRKNTSNGQPTYAEQCKYKLLRMGIDERVIIAVPTTKNHRSRTFSYAQSTVEWIRQNRATTKAINIFTLGTHARKSYVLYKKATGKEINVGVISAPPVDYNPLYWYLSNIGIGFVFKNLMGYLQAMILTL